MLTEIAAARQDDPDRRRRWFQDDYFDLFIWQDRSGETVAFQLCYDRSGKEGALSWSRDKGYSHNRVDSGEDKPRLAKMSPLMVAGGVFPLYTVAPRFEQAALAIDAAIGDFVLARLREYPRALYGPMRRPRRKKQLQRHGRT